MLALYSGKDKPGSGQGWPRPRHVFLGCCCGGQTSSVVGWDAAGAVDAGSRFIHSRGDVFCCRQQKMIVL